MKLNPVCLLHSKCFINFAEFFKNILLSDNLLKFIALNKFGSFNYPALASKH